MIASGQQLYGDIRSYAVYLLCDGHKHLMLSVNYNNHYISLTVVLT